MDPRTIINTGLTRSARPIHALVLMGGGARTAYQVGVLRAMASILKLQAKSPSAFPFQVLVGTSAGALNAAYLASAATRGLQAFDWLGQFWSRVRSCDVYELDVPRWARTSRLATAFSLWRNARRR